MASTASRPLALGFVMDSLGGVDIDADTTFAFLLEAQRRGHALWYMELRDLSVRDGRAGGRMTGVAVKRARPCYTPHEIVDRPLGDLDAIFMRKDPPFTTDYIFATYILSLVPAPTFIINDPAGLRAANEKMYALHFPEAIPPTLVSKDQAALAAFVRDMGEAVVKPLDGRGGYSVFKTGADDLNLRALLELMTHEGRTYIMAQQYLPAIRAGDKRILLLDGEPIGVVRRVPRPDDLRSNVHVGGRCEAASLSERDRFLCALVAPRLRADGLYFVGLDVIGEYITEINVTSPTLVQEIDRLYGVCLEAQVLDFVEGKVAQARAR